MHVGLIDIDGHNWPNLVLMKLSTYYKELGGTVELLKPADVESYSLFSDYDRIYAACVFESSRQTAVRLKAAGVEVGGSGVSLDMVLPGYIDMMHPDYGLYGITDTAYGFLTRGCPRQCPFCIVSKKEGNRSYKVADLSQFWDGQKNIKLLDPNLLACKESLNLLHQLADSNAYVDFTQGLDIRLMTKEAAGLINNTKIKTLHFAWDNAADNETYEKLKYWRQYFNLDFRRLRVYVLTNFSSSHVEDIKRVNKLRELGYDPYIMIYDKDNAPKRTRYLQRWVNNKRVFRTIDKFSDFDPRKG